MKAVIYARFSCSRQREASIDDQLRICNEYAESEGIEVVRTYCDYAMSGRTDDRPQFQEMISNAGESSIVLVYMMDRFSRDQYDAPIYKQKLAKKGVRVVSAMERIDATPDGIIMEKLLEGLAARESMVTSQRVRRGMEGNAMRCLYNGDRIYGYSVDQATKRYVIEPSEAEVVRMAFEMKVRSVPVNAIAKEMAKRGAKTATGRPMGYESCRKLLKREQYCGVYRWGDVRVEGGMPAIVDRATWEAAQAAQARKVRAHEEFHEYPLTGRVLCGTCGTSMYGACAYGKGGTRYDYYRCNCGAPSINRKKLESAIVDALRDLLGGDDAYEVARIVERAWKDSGEVSTVEAARKRLRAAEEASRRLVTAVENGMPYAMVAARMDALNAEIETAKADILMHENDGDFSVDDFVDFLRFGATLDDETLLQAFVWQVLPMDGCYVVTLNYDANENTPARFEIPAEVFGKNIDGGPHAVILEHMVGVRAGVIWLLIAA